MMEKRLSNSEALEAMKAFLEQFYQKRKSDDVAGLLSDLSLSAHYQPNAGTNWLAIRPRDTTPTSDLTCKNGCLVDQSSGHSVIEKDSNFGWSIVNIAPGSASTQFAMDFDFRFINHMNEHHESIEVLEFSPHGSKNAPPLNMTHLNDASENQSGLLAYIASVQTALSPGGWLLPENNQIETAALLSLSRFQLLSELANTDIGKIPTFGSLAPSWYPYVQWKERQNFLKKAEVSVAFRIFEHYGKPLEHQILLLDRHVRTLSTLANLTKTALDSGKQLGEQEYLDLLSRTSRALKTKPFTETSYIV